MFKVKRFLKYGEIVAICMFAVIGFVVDCVTEHNFLKLISPILIFCAVVIIVGNLWDYIKKKFPVVDDLSKHLFGIIRDLPKLFSIR